jgi:predicted ester cyclase
MGDSEANVETIRRLEAAWASSDYDTVKKILDPNFKNGGPGAETMPPGIDGLIEGAKMSHTAFPDKKQELLDVFGEGDKVVSRVRMTGTNKGGLPWFGVPANDKAVDIEWITIYTLAGGKVVETSAQMEIPQMMMQLGAMPNMEEM